MSALPPSTQVPAAGAAVPRRRPTQTRSRITYDAILEAAAQALSSGADGDFTMSSIARRAGVSPGSLYQYFSGKPSLLGGLLEAHVARLTSALVQASGETAGRPLQEAVGAVVRAYVAVHARDAPLVLHLARLTEHAGWGEAMGEVARKTEGILASLVASRVSGTAGGRSETVVYVAALVLRASVHQALSERPEVITTEGFAVEMARLLQAYLCESAESCSLGSNHTPDAARVSLVNGQTISSS